MKRNSELEIQRLEEEIADIRKELDEILQQVVSRQEVLQWKMHRLRQILDSENAQTMLEEELRTKNEM